MLLWQKKGPINFLLVIHKGICFCAPNYQINHVQKEASFFFFFSFGIYSLLRLSSQALAGAQNELGQPITSQGHGWEKCHQTFFPVWQQILQQFSHSNGPFISCWSIWVNGNFGRVFPLKPRGETVCTCRWKIFKATAIKIHVFCRKKELPLYWYLIFLRIKHLCKHFLPYQKLISYMKPKQ